MMRAQHNILHLRENDFFSEWFPLLCPRDEPPVHRRKNALTRPWAIPPKESADSHKSFVRHEFSLLTSKADFGPYFLG